MKKILLSIALLFFVCFFAGTVLAGTIDAVFKYAWSNKIGWINFGNSNGNVEVNDSTVTGYAWNDNYGWINLSPTNGGVTNTTSGTLGGYAWGENTGWINFGGASIDCSGEFSGTATGDVVGTI